MAGGLPLVGLMTPHPSYLTVRSSVLRKLMGFALAVAWAPFVVAAPITEAEVNAAQQAWCDGLVKISQTAKEGGDAKAVAAQVIDDLYDYKEGMVFFKPTLAYGKNTFRPTREGALAYFVGGNKDFPEDTGFALKTGRWRVMTTMPRKKASRFTGTSPSRWATSISPMRMERK